MKRLKIDLCNYLIVFIFWLIPIDHSILWRFFLFKFNFKKQDLEIWFLTWRILEKSFFLCKPAHSTIFFEIKGSSLLDFRCLPQVLSTQNRQCIILTLKCGWWMWLCWMKVFKWCLLNNIKNLLKIGSLKSFFLLMFIILLIQLNKKGYKMILIFNFRWI